MSNLIVAIDVGGTFTDLIGYDIETGAVSSTKTPSTPPDFIDGMINGMVALGCTPDEIALIKIGTTIATNTIIMRTGAKTALADDERVQGRAARRARLAADAVQLRLGSSACPGRAQGYADRRGAHRL